MTPSQDKDDNLKNSPRGGTAKESNRQASVDTARNLRDGETPRVDGTESDILNALPGNLSPDELNQAKAALTFLKEVRNESQHSSKIPSSIGRYSILRSIGRGGFAEVFLAHDEELDRRVALKVPLFNSSTNEAGRQRFEREARLAASLGHPQIVPVYEYGDLGAIRFIAFAWCDGPNLSDWINDNGPVSFSTAANIVRHLAEAVQHAHQRGVVHRDLKPGNILVDNSEESAGKPVWERLRITDFGLARSTENVDATLTQDGQLVGTPAYMAPEQVESNDVGASADIWALGMILMELLTGKLPFRRSDAFATLKAISDTPAPKANTLRNDVPSGLNAIVDSCLRKNPKDRYESAHQLAEDLRRWAAGEPIVARTPSALVRLAMWTRRNPVVASLITLTIVSLATGLGVSLWQRSVALNNLREARAQAARADDNLVKAQELINDIIYLEQNLGMQMPLNKQRMEMLQRASRMQVALIKDEERTPEVRFATAMTFKNLSELFVRLGEYEAAIENGKYVISQLEGLEDDLPADLTPKRLFQNRMLQRMKMLDALNSLGRFDEAMKIFEANEREAAPDNLDPFFLAVIRAENMRARSVISITRGDKEDAVVALKLALKRIDKITPADDRKQLWDWSLTHCRLGFALADMMLEQESVEGLEELLKRTETNLAKLKESFPKHPFVQKNEAELQFRLGKFSLLSNNLTEAITHFEACRVLRLAIFKQSPKFPALGLSYAKACLELAKAHVENDELQTGVEVAQKAVKRTAAFPKKWLTDPSVRSKVESLQRIADMSSDEIE